VLELVKDDPDLMMPGNQKTVIETAVSYHQFGVLLWLLRHRGWTKAELIEKLPPLGMDLPGNKQISTEVKTHMDKLLREYIEAIDK